MRETNGNLLDMFDNGDFDIIIHGCNCHQDMGGGIAAQIAKRYLKVEAADNARTDVPISRLGTIDPVRLSSRLFGWFVKTKVVINAYTQYNPGADGNHEAIKRAFYEVVDFIYDQNWQDKKIGIPAIGCGIAGLEWEDVEYYLDIVCRDLDITLVVFE